MRNSSGSRGVALGARKGKIIESYFTKVSKKSNYTFVNQEISTSKGNANNEKSNDKSTYNSTEDSQNMNIQYRLLRSNIVGF